MAYSIEELLANKNTIQRMPLLEIYSKYGARDLLTDEIKRRVVSDIEEVRDFYKYHSPFAYFGDYQNNLEELSNLLKISPVELLDWNCFTEINDTIAKEYLDSDTSWLNYKNIPKKVSKSFLRETLLKDNNLYKHSELIELLSGSDLKSILLSNNIDISKIPNIIDIINNHIELSEFKEIALKYYNQNNYAFFSQLLSLDKLKSYELEQLLLNLQNNSSFDDFLKLLNNLPSNIIQHINQNGYFLEKIMKPYINDQEKIEKVLNSTFASNLNYELIKKILLYLPINKLFDILITNNNYYEILKDEIDLKTFSIYFNENADKCLNVLTTSNLVYDFLENPNYYPLIEEKNIEKCFQYILNDIESLKYCFKNKFEFGKDNLNTFIFNESTNLTLLQQENIANAFFEIPFLNIEIIFKIFDRYSYIKEKVVSNIKFEEYINNEKTNQEYLFAIVDRYPETLSMLNLNLITHYDHSIIMRYLDKYPKVEKLLMNNDNFLSFILSNEQSILNFMPLINKYNINNETIKLFNDSFKKIQEVRPELSWGNSSLRTEMLSEDFINILGTNYIDAILQYDSDASDIVVNIYNQNKLNDLKQWLDYLNQNISNNFRMIHYYILSYSKMEKLANELMNNNTSLNDYEKQILEEIIENNNLYEIKSLNELDNYFEIKADKILNNKEEITGEELYELFFNTSSLQNGVPWGLSFDLTFLNLDYIKYKYVDTGIITTEEFKYIKMIKDIKENRQNNNNHYDISMIREIVKQYEGFKIPTARSIINKIREAKLEEFNSKLLDLDEIRKIASYTDPTAQVYIESKDGIEYIHLNGFDYRCMACAIVSAGSGTHEATRSTFSEKLDNGFEQYTVLSEKIKERNGYQNLRTLGLSGLINENPENWDLIEGVSTVSTGISSSRFRYSGFAWGRKSNISVLGMSQADGMVSHNIRDLKPNKTFWEGNSNQRLYDTKRGEIWFDRFDENNERVHPEFIMSGNINDEKKAARYFGIPIVVRHDEYYPEDEIDNRLDLEARNNFLETFDINSIDNILFNHKNNNDDEKTDFIINSLKKALNSNILDYQTYISKLIQLKWKLYETSFEKQFERVNSIIIELSNYDYKSFEQAKSEFELLTEQERKKMTEEGLEIEETQQEVSHIR